MIKRREEIIMKKYWKIPIFFLIFIMVFLPVKASDKEYTTSVQYISDEKVRQTFLLEVQGYGSIYDGKQTIKNGSIEYQLSIGEEKTFKIIPDEGYEVSHIYYRVTTKQRDIQTVTRDLVSEMVDNSITIQIVEGKIELKIEFEKKQNERIEEETKTPPSYEIPSNSTMNTPPNTGEASTIVLYGMLTISYFTLLYVRRNARKEYLQK